MMMYRTEDAEEILSILKTPGIWENIGGKDSAHFEPPITPEYHYLVMREGNETAGLFILHGDENELKIHANMIPGFRGEIAEEAANMALEYGFSITDLIVAEIPTKFPNVALFAGKFMTPVSTTDGIHRFEARNT